MSFNYSLHPEINLLVEGRITPKAAERQMRTAAAILERLYNRPGQILADEVGMGKTFVALAVAVSVFLKDKKPVVIMIPANLLDKWPNDFNLFKEFCIKDDKLSQSLKCSTASRPEEFLKLLDDSEERRSAIIFLTHGALARKVSDGWIKLAIIQKALYRRRDTSSIYKSLSNYAGDLLELRRVENKNWDIYLWDLLLNSSPTKWKKILVKHGFFEDSDDDPVPELFLKELERESTSNLNELYYHLREAMPKRYSEQIRSRLREVRKVLNEEAKQIWTRCMKKLKLELPLLIFDEAHHLKNSETQLVTTLFHDPVAEEDAGILTGQFNRMLFLTATPFQLGHHELFKVLERFKTINWAHEENGNEKRKEFSDFLEQLLKKLDASQIAARRLDNSWSKLAWENIINREIENPVYHWWLQAPADNPIFQNLKNDFDFARQKLKEAEEYLKQFVVRHLKPQMMEGEYIGVRRRNSLCGSMILKDFAPCNNNVPGIPVAKESLLPFLLAARLTSLNPEKRPVFAEGLASSYEAFRFTRQQRLEKEAEAVTDSDDDIEEDSTSDLESEWYLDNLAEAISNSSYNGVLHPKIKPTVEKAMDLWLKGEKVLIFCHYIATGKALRKYISQQMKLHILQKGAEMLNCPEGEVFTELEKLADKITAKDSKLRETCEAILGEMFTPFHELVSYKEKLIEVILRYFRTPSFLVRFLPPLQEEIDEAWLRSAFENKDESGIAFKEIIIRFLAFLHQRKEDRESFITYLRSIQPGGIRVTDLNLDEEEEDLEKDETDNTVMANVRLCYGATKPETRRKLMKTFNTPFFPDILITSNVMAEGVDLHINCRYIIHHDLCWNPSTLEQRTGRVDRIGAKAEKCGQPIQVYLPYISETQDEKMYRVVMERERWFNIIMGHEYKVDAVNTDKYADRVPFPEELARELAFNLEIK